MRKFIILIALLLVSQVTYGQSNGWVDAGTIVKLETSTDKVGIGIDDVDEKLEVAGNVRVTGVLMLGDEDNYISAEKVFGVQIGANGSDVMNIWGSRKRVGINVKYAQEKLHIYQSSSDHDDVRCLLQNDCGPSGDKGAYFSLWPKTRNAALEIYDESGSVVDWSIGKNGTDNFSVKDGESGHRIFQIEPGGVGYTLYLNDDGRVGIGTNLPFAKLHVNGTARFDSTVKMRGKVYFYDKVGIGIGTSEPQSELAVNGTITAKEVIVTLDGWPDFVFADNYKPMPLNKLERYIKLNKSLPDIPKEKEVVKEGVNLGEMQAKLLAKVEELTLYVIELKKENEELKERISALEK